MNRDHIARYRPIPAMAAVLALATCGPAPLDPGRPYAPVGTPSGASHAPDIEVAHRLLASGEADLALRSFYRAAAEDGLTAEILAGLGSANLALGRLGQAERLLRRATRTDETFVPAWNNLGVVLVEQGAWGEASRVFRTAFALDSGQSAEIRNNLRLALAGVQAPDYSPSTKVDFALVRRGKGEYLIRAAPGRGVSTSTEP